MNTKLDNILRKLVRESIMNEAPSLKGAVNQARSDRADAQSSIQKEKWFDKLPLQDKQRYYNNMRGRKSNLTFIKDLDKISIYNKIHNGSYYSF